MSTFPRPSRQKRRDAVRIASTLLCAATCALGCADGTTLREPPVRALETAAAPVILALTASGDGCPVRRPPTWESELAEGGTSVSVYFNAFQASSLRRRSNVATHCKLSVKIAGKRAHEYVPEPLLFEGYGDLPEAGHVTVNSALRWADAQAEGEPRTSQTIAGRFEGEKELRFGGDLPAWSGCGAADGERVLDIDTTIDTQRSSFALTALKGLRFVARACPEVEGGGASDGGTMDAALDGGTPVSDGGIDADAGPVTPPIDPPNAGPIEKVETEGYGCPANGSTIRIAPDGTTFDVALNGLEASTAPETTTRLINKTCTVIVTLKKSTTETYALDTVSGSGHAQLAAGQRMVMLRSYASVTDFQSPPAFQQAGPFDDAFTFSDAFGERGPSVACGSTYFRLSLSLTLYNTQPPAAGRIRMERLGNVRFALRSCAR